MTDFPQLFRLLATAGVDYIVVGGMAATVHGSARLTEDLDIVYRRAEENLRRLVDALAPHRRRFGGIPGRSGKD